jgi:copper(I)-binding protein
MRIIPEIVWAALGLLLAVSPAQGATLAVQDAWIREAPPTASVLAAYMVINNTGESLAGITAIASPDFERTELHRTVVESGVARMVAIEKLEIPSGDKLSLDPGGIHLMLINPLRPLRAGDTVTLVIQGDDGASTTVSVPVVREAGEAAHQHH